MKQILPTLILIALLAGCGKQHEPSSSESPVPETESPSQASESSAELEELSALLKKEALKMSNWTLTRGRELKPF